MVATKLRNPGRLNQSLEAICGPGSSLGTIDIRRSDAGGGYRGRQVPITGRWTLAKGWVCFGRCEDD